MLEGDTTKMATSSSTIAGTTCMELALEGERLCKTGDFKNGVKFFEEAIKVRTGDDRTLSAIYSQLGNAYFYMEDFKKALEYHDLDVKLVHAAGDEAAEAKACGNLGNTYKMLGKFDEAAFYCRRYLEISRKLNDEVGEARALYNLGNVYHTQGKRMIGTIEQEPGELSSDMKSSLEKAIEHYEANLKVVTKLKDYASMGRAYGNMGNTHYLLGNFEEAVENHGKRLELAIQLGDKSAERRAHLNLGNANVFLGNFNEAVGNYSATLAIAQELQDKSTEAHACYSLANTYTFLRDYRSAITYHLKFLEMIKDTDDKLGEGRACWSLVNIYQMVNDPESALTYAKRHHEIAELLGDKSGLASAKLNIEELQEIISQKQAAQQACANSSSQHHHHHHQADTNQSINATASKKFTSESLNIFRLTPDKRQEQEQRRFKKQLNSNLAGDIDGLAARRRGRNEKGTFRSQSSERLFDMIAHFQSGRIDDQRCEILKKSEPLVTEANKMKHNDEKENLTFSKSEPGNPGGGNRGSQPSIINPMSAVSAAASAIKSTYRKASLAAYPVTGLPTPSIQSQRRPTVSAEHREQLFDLIAGAQGQRMDEQRASLPALTLANGVLKNPINASLLSRGHTIDQSNSRPSCRKTSESVPDTILEGQSRSKSHSIAPQASIAAVPSARMYPQRVDKLLRHAQTIDSETHDEKFLDNLMKYQSTRFDEQRSEFPKKNAQADNSSQAFFNLLVKFQSDRINDQRSAPPRQARTRDTDT